MAGNFWNILFILMCNLYITIYGESPTQYNIFLQHPSPQEYRKVAPSVSQFSSPAAFDISQQSNMLLPQKPLPVNNVAPQQPGCAMPPAACPKTRYRSYDGSCNNLRNPVLGMPVTPYTRLLPPIYGDGVYSPTIAISGKELPNARSVSLVLFPDVPIEDPQWNLNAMQYGQIITHDMSMILGSTQAQKHQTRCCTDDGQLLDFSPIPEHCFAIILPESDPITKQTNARCMNFVRTINTRDRQCVTGYEPAEQLTAVNHYLDLSIVYGNTDQVNQQVRQFQGGRLLVDVKEGKEWLPRNPNASMVCAIRSPQESCYLAGDTRVNQNPQLTVLQTILLREHNRLANALAKLNPHWDDETLFQEARRITIAEHQYISYYEWLPIFIGLENSLKNQIIFNTKGYVNDYSESVNPTVLNEHANAAFRYFHSLIAGHLDLITEHRESYGSLRLSDWFNRPAILEENNNFDDLTRGLATQPELASDQFHDSEITQFLFRDGQLFGSDLKAIDIQRNRDHGLSSYNSYRNFCGLPKATRFEDLLDVISKENVQKLSTLYETVDDIDLTVGGALEVHVPGTLAGPTFLCILTEQFFRTRTGDRFWFENGDHRTSFTLEQLNEIKKTSISRLFCDNGDNIKSMQPRGFERTSQVNAVVPCESLPFVDLSFWKDLGMPSEVPSLHFADELFFKK